jgi:hypothetical protein
MGGAAVGGFLGRSTPEGGFGAANNFFLQQRMRQMQSAQFLQQMQLNQSNIVKNRAEAQHAAAQGAISRTGPSITVKDTDPDSPTFGKMIVKTQNPQTGEYDTTAGEAPDKVKNFKEISTNQGLGAFDQTNPQAGVIPLKMRGTPDGTAASNVASDTAGLSGDSASGPSRVAAGNHAPTKFNSGSPRTPGSPSASPTAIAATGGGVPLGPPNKTATPNAENDTFEYLTKPIAQGGKGLAPDRAWAQINADRRKPDASQSPTPTPQQERTLRNSFATREETALRQLQSEQEKDLDDLEKNSPLAEPGELEQKRTGIQAKYDQQRQAVHGRMVEEAAGLGIDLDTPMAKAAKPGMPRTAPGAAKTAAQGDTSQPQKGKVANTTDILAYAQKAGINSAEARKRFLAKGYRIVPTTGPAAASAHP